MRNCPVVEEGADTMVGICLLRHALGAIRRIKAWQRTLGQTVCRMLW